MRFMVMHKNDARTEAGGPPDPKVVREMGVLIGGLAKDGKFKDGAGLRQSALRSRVVSRGGGVTIEHGPYSGRHELAAGFIHVKVKSRDEALGWAKRVAAILGDVELEVGRVTEQWDIGLAPYPEGPVPEHYLLVNKATPDTESGAPPSDALRAKMGALIGEMTSAGVFVSAAGLQPSKTVTRFRFAGGKPTVTDGPFAESKELVGGFCILEGMTRDELVAFVHRYAAVLGDVEVDLRPLAI